MSWVTIDIGGKEKLFCDCCHLYKGNTHDRIVFHLNIDEGKKVDTILCKKCWDILLM